MEKNQNVETIAWGKYATLALNYLKDHKKATYTQLLVAEELNNYLTKVDKNASAMAKTLNEKLDKIEQYKKTDNFLRNYQIEEEKRQIIDNAILTELVYV